MKNSLKFIIIILLLSLFSINLKSERQNLKITPLMENALKYGRLYIQKKKIKGSPWPEITIITSIDATPEQSAAIFFAYDEHKEFIPDLLISKPIRYLSPTKLHIYFEMNLPWPVRNSKFITNNILSEIKGGGYKIRWEFVKSNSTKDSYGGVSFIPYKNKTMLIYENYTLPKSGLARIFKKAALKKVKKTVFSIKSRIETIVENKKDKLPHYIKNLHRALNGEYIYKRIKP